MCKAADVAFYVECRRCWCKVVTLGSITRKSGGYRRRISRRIEICRFRRFRVNNGNISTVVWWVVVLYNNDDKLTILSSPVES